MDLAGKLASSRFRKAAVLVAAIALISGASVYAYFSSLPPPRGPRVSVISSPLELSMELEKAEYAYGENITVALCVRNVGNETVTITKYSKTNAYDPGDMVLFTEAEGVSEPYCSSLSGWHSLHIGVSIEAENGTKVYKLGVFGVLQVLYDIVIEPGGYLKQKLVLVTYTYRGGPEPIPLPRKGTYQMRAILYRIGVRIGAESTPWVTIETPSITIISR